MFTGIIQGVSKVLDIKKKNNFYTYKLEFSEKLVKNLKKGDSVSNNGCCLTVISINKCHVSFDIVSETLKVTNLSLLSVGSIVNIERSLKVGDEIGGHFISGHIMHTARVSNIITDNNNKTMYFQAVNVIIMKYIFLKGFITIDGISLTVHSVKKNIFSVCLIPETVLNTNMIYRVIGDIVNIEVDYYTQIVIDKLEQYISSRKCI